MLSSATAGLFRVNEGHFDCLGEYAGSKADVSDSIEAVDQIPEANNSPELCARQLGEGWATEAKPYAVSSATCNRTIIIPGYQYQQTDCVHLIWDCVSLLHDGEYVRCDGSSE
ncbi:hypothetical protein PYCC9005_001806 [Savitreella phatthalungensis]